MHVRRIIRWGLVLLIGLPVLLAALLFALVYTETGSRFVIGQALARAGDGVKIGSVNGRLWDRLELLDVRVDAAPVEATVNRVSVSWQPRALLDGILRVDATELDGIDLTVIPQPSQDPSAPPTTLPAPPLPMELRRLELRRLTIHTSGRDILIDRLALGAAWDADKFSLTGFDLEAYGHRLGVAGSVAVGNRPKVAASADWTGDLGGEPGQASLEVSGPLSQLEFQTTLDAAVSAQLRGSINPLADQPSLAVHGTVTAPELGEGITLGETRLDVEGTFESLTVSIATDAETPQTGAYALSLDTILALPTGADDAIVADIEWQAEPRRADGESIVGSGKVTYEGDSVRIDHATAAPYRTRLGGDVTLAPAGPVLDLELGWTGIRYALSETQVVTAREGKIAVKGPLDDMAMELASEFELPQVGPAGIAGEGHLSGQSFSLTQLTAALLGGEIHAAGAVDWSDTVGSGIAPVGPVLELKAGWTDIRYPLSETQVITGREGRFELKGPLGDMAMELASEFQLPQVGRAGIAGSGRLAGQRFSLTQLTAALLAGEIRTAGEVDWSDTVGGDFRFSGRDIDLTALRADTPSRLAFGGSAGFRLGTDGMTSRVEVATLSGSLRGQAVAGNASLQTRPGELVVDRAQFDVGPNRIDLRGTWAEQMSGRFDLRLKDLAVFDSRLGGSISGSGTFGGQPALPQIDARLEGRALQIDRITAHSLDAIINVDMARDIESRADLTIETVAIEGKPLGRLAFAGRGNARSHGLRLDFDGDGISLKAAANGVWQDRRWRGRVREMSIDSEIAGAWSLAEPSDVALAAGEASLTDACFESEPARVCVAGKHKETVSNARITLAALPLQLTDHYLPATLRLRGAADGAADLRVVDGVVTGTGRLGVTNGTIERDAGGGTADTLAIEAFAIDFDLSPDSIEAEADAKVEEWFALHGSVTAARKPGGAVAAAIDARSADISWLAEFFPELGGSTGGFELSSSVTGSFEAPIGTARLALTDGVLRVPDMGLEITRIDAVFGGDSRSIDIDTEIGAGDGTLTLDGIVSIDEEKRWRYDLKLDGSNFPLVRIPEAEADVSPALRLVGDPDSLHVTGTLLVPRVFIDVKRLPNSAISVSEDQIIVAADGSVPEGAANGSFLTDKVSGEVAIRLGDDISINGFGLTSKLSGGIDWTKKRGSALGSANGVILVDKGVFKAYGQHMQIEKGRIVFAGPIDNPGLNVRAVRPDLPVKVGVNVSGTVRVPKISLFSEPPQSDGNTLAYIVTGRALDEASGSDASLLTQAALSLGAEQSAVVTNQISSALGLDEFSVAAGDTARDTSLIAGKRLSPKLSVRTDFNPFDQLWSFFLNYKLTQRWSIEAESGERQGADLLYSIERERLIDALLPFD